MTSRLTVIAAALVIAPICAAGCGASGSPDKAGGDATPVTLRLATQDRAGFPGANLIAHFADDVRRRSNGSIRIVVTYDAAGSGPRWDQRVASLVRSGRFDLGLVPARAWDVLGVRSMQALQTPFLVQSTQQLDRVTADRPLDTAMLAGLRSLGVTGLALIPESLRHPFAFRGTLRTPHDFTDVKIRAPLSNATWALLRSLGARPVDLAPSIAAIRAGTVRGAESDLAQAAATLPATATATSNVTFFPRVDSLVANTHAFDRLSARARTILEQAASDTVTWAPQSNPSESAAARAFCRSGGHVVAASGPDVKALIAATRPVTIALERDPGTRALIAEVRQVAGPPSAAPAPTCEPAKATVTPRLVARGRATPIDGVYRNTVTVHDLIAGGVDRGTAIENAPHIHTIVLRRGRLHDTTVGGVVNVPCDGHYTVRGDTYTFAWDTTAQCTGDFTAHWSLHRGELRLTSISALSVVDQTVWGSKPFRKIG